MKFLYGIHTAISVIYDWVKKFSSRIRVSRKRKERTQVAVDETIIKCRKKRFYVWSAIDLQTKELVAFDVSRGRSSLDSLVFLSKVKIRCRGKLPIVVTDKGPWYPYALRRLGFDHMHNTFSIRNPIEQFFRLVKDRTRIFYNNMNTDNGIKHLILFMKLFAFYYSNIREVIA